MKKHFFLCIGCWGFMACFPMSPCNGVEKNNSLRPPEKGQILAREKPQLLLYYSPWCPYCQKVLDYLKQIHRTVPTKNLQQVINGKDELRRIGGKMQVPCLIIDGKALYESAVIIQWLSQNRDILETN